MACGGGRAVLTGDHLPGCSSACLGPSLPPFFPGWHHYPPPPRLLGPSQPLHVSPPTCRGSPSPPPTASSSSSSCPLSCLVLSPGPPLVVSSHPSHWRPPTPSLLCLASFLSVSPVSLKSLSPLPWTSPLVPSCPRPGPFVPPLPSFSLLLWLGIPSPPLTPSVWLSYPFWPLWSPCLGPSHHAHPNGGWGGGVPRTLPLIQEHAPEAAPAALGGSRRSHCLRQVNGMPSLSSAPLPPTGFLGKGPQHLPGLCSSGEV